MLTYNIPIKVGVVLPTLQSKVSAISVPEISTWKIFSYITWWVWFVSWNHGFVRYNIWMQNMPPRMMYFPSGFLHIIGPPESPSQISSAVPSIALYVYILSIFYLTISS